MIENRKPMKIGVLTVHCSCNPGASLQAHAVCKILSKLGYEPCIIDYRPQYFIDIVEKASRGVLTGRERLKMTALGHRLKKRYEKFCDFERLFYPSKTQVYQTQDDLLQNPPMFDAYLCGSDQIWNPQHIHYDESFFFSFLDGNKKPVISYAASIGQDELKQEDIQFLNKNISRLSSVSVREKSAATLIRSMGYRCVQNIDPTLLFGADYWRSISVMPPKRIPDHYILYYPLQHNPLELLLIQAMKDKTGLPCVAVESALKKTKGVDVQIPYYSPKEYLWLIDHADYVVTNSFHGCLFSILFGKRVVPFRNQYRNSRLENLFSLLNMSGMQTESLDDFQKKDWEDYWSKETEAIEIIRSEQGCAIEYLRRALHDDK